MKPCAISLLLLVTCLFSGCVYDDTDSCVDPTASNLTLNFVYTTNGTNDVFAEYIDQVDVFVYNSDNRLVHRQMVGQSSLTAFAGTTMNLPAGKYRLVCWGNAFEQTAFKGVESGSLFSEARTYNATLGGTLTAINGDALYYAPSSVRDTPAQAFYVTVPAVGSETATIAFRCAHVKIEVYVKGFKDYADTGNRLAPVVKLAEVPADYTFDMETSSSAISYLKATAPRVTNGQQMDVVDYYPPLCEPDTPLTIYINKPSDGTTLATVSLKEFIADNQIDLTGTAQVVIPILVEFNSIGVSVTFPEWKNNPVEPEP